MIKQKNFDVDELERKKREQEEEAEKEREERKHAVEVLMRHGISASNSLQVSRRAAFERKLSSQSVQTVSEMIDNHKKEIESYRLRLLELEA